MIHYDAQAGIWHLSDAGFSYVIGKAPQGGLRHLHAGKAVQATDFSALDGAWKAPAREQFLERHAWDFASFGNNDLRSPSIFVEQADGSRLSEFKVSGYSASNDQLQIDLEDAVAGQTLELH